MATPKLTERQLELIKRVACRGSLRPEKGEFSSITALKRAGLVTDMSATDYQLRANHFTPALDALLLEMFPAYHAERVHFSGVLFAPGLRVMCSREPTNGHRSLVGIPDNDLLTPLRIIADVLNKETSSHA